MKTYWTVVEMATPGYSNSHIVMSALWIVIHSHE